MTLPLSTGAGGTRRRGIGAAGARESARPDPLEPLLDLAGVRDASEAARAAVDRLLGHRVLRRESAGVSAESALRGARASAALDGVDVPLAALRAGSVDDPVVQGALRVSVGLGSMADTWMRAPGQVLARLHVLAAADLADRATLAGPVGRAALAGPVGRAELGRPGAHAGPRLAGLFGLVTGATAGPAVLVAAVVHGELAAMAPFGSADGVVARAAARLTVVARGLDPKAVSVPEVGYAEMGREGYADGLAGYASGTPAGVARWMVHCCRATELGALEGLAICESVIRG